MKFFTKLFFVLALSFALQACGGSSKTETKTNTEDVTGGQENKTDSTQTGGNDDNSNVSPQ